MKYLSLFSGIGGFELGIQQAQKNKCEFCSNKVEMIIDNEGDGYCPNCETYEEKQIHNLGRDTGTPDTENGRHKPMPDISNGDGGRTDTDFYECVGYSEIDKYAIQTYEKHFNHKNYGDITKIQWDEMPDFNMLVGGFPCQAFSIAGKRKGFEDTRGTLFFDIAKGLRIKQPDFVVLENVKGLISHNKGETLDVILETLQELGYYVNIEVYNSKDFGVPQNRERIIFVCRHIKTLIKDGENLNLSMSRQIISEYLFQILLNNLAEVKKLQEEKSKDWVIGYLLLREIYQNQRLNEESTKDGITTPMEEKCSLSEEGLWQNIGILLNNEKVESSKNENKSITLTAIKETIDQKTYTFSQMQKAILLAIVHLRSSSKSLWNEMLSDLIVIKENTKYARINDKKEEIIISETGNAYISSDIQKNEQHFIIGHLRGTSRPEVFPITGEPEEDTRNVGEDLSYTVDANYAKGTNTLAKGRRQLVQLNNPTHSNDRVYSEDGIGPTLNTMQGGNRQPFISKTIRVGGQKSPHGSKQNWDSYEIDGKIRRLTPKECERLQGFPDDWTEGVSDTQRYKQCGNAVTVNVIEEIVKRLLT